MSYNYLLETKMNQLAEQYTNAISNNDTLNAQMSILCLTTEQRLNLSPELLLHNKLVWDIDTTRFYTWSIVNGNYQWTDANLVGNYFYYRIQRKQKTVTISDNIANSPNSVYFGDLEGSGFTYDGAKQVMLVTLDGSLLIEGVHYTVDTVNKGIYPISGGNWYIGQKMTIIILYDSQTTEETPVSALTSRVVILESQVDTLQNTVLNKVKMRVWS